MNYLRKLHNITGTNNFFINKGNCKVIFFTVPSEILISYLEENPFEKVNNIINTAYKFTENDKQNKDKTKHIVKLAWLINDIKKQGIRYPLQLIKSSESKYIFHPGTFRIAVATAVLSLPQVTGFYLWYPEIDPNPFVLDYEWHEVSNAKEFLSTLNLNKTGSITEIRLTQDTNIREAPRGIEEKFNSVYIKQYHAQFRTAYNCFSKLSKQFDVRFLTYYDNQQWIDIDKTGLSFNDVVNFDNNQCNISGVVFENKNEFWFVKN